MAEPQAAADHAKAAATITAATLAAMRRLWARLGTGNFDTAWRTLGPQMTAVLTAGQLAVARDASAYTLTAADELGIAGVPAGGLVPEALAGVASDGRPLDSLLYEALIPVRTLLGRGGGLRVSLEVGQEHLDRMVTTQMADAGRAASSVETAVQRSITGWVRMLTLPSCDRCAVMAGRFYRWNEGFWRHPRCDCKHIPATEDVAGDIRTDPRKAIESGQVTGLSKADYKAIVEDGADVSQVINAKRGMSTEQVFGHRLKVTSEGTTRRGRARRAMGNAPVRLRPESIYQVAKDRDDAIRLLRHYGYITDEPSQPMREGFGTFGKGGKAKAAREAVLEARRTGVRDLSNPYTMTAAELRVYRAEMRDLFAAARISSPPAFFARMTLAQQRGWLERRARMIGH